ncbi:MAG: biotin attachment protein [Thaumarchaeota archaeon]|nr:biotin attachment protein [Nitrososphaerota archaeon]
MPDSTTHFELYADESSFIVDAEKVGEDIHVRIEGETYRVRIERIDGEDLLRAYLNGRALNVRLEEQTESSMTLRVGDELIKFQRSLPKFDRLAKRSQKSSTEEDCLNSPMPGRVVSVMVKEGQSVRSGDPVVILESMKMETILMSDRDAIVGEILVKEGDAVKSGRGLVRYFKGGSPQ